MPTERFVEWLRASGWENSQVEEVDPELYDFLFVRPTLWLGRLLWHRGDEKTIDRFGPHGAAYAVGIGNRVTYRVQSGFLYSYALVMLLGLIGAASWAIWWAK